MKNVSKFLLAVLLVFALPAGAGAAVTGRERCEAALEMASARYGQCRLAAEARFATNADAVKRNQSLSKCATKLTSSFAKSVKKFGSTSCSALAPSAFEARLAECSDDVVAASKVGGAFPSRGAIGLVATGQVTCWDLGGTQIDCAGTGQDGELRRGAPMAYVDNGDGTISDAATGLMWEKNSRNDRSIHDFSGRYSWDEAFEKIATLNAGSGFAGHTDWRLPNRRELESIVDLERDNYPAINPVFQSNCPASTDPCGVLECSCTAPSSTWTSSTARVQGVEMYAWTVFFFNGAVGPDSKDVPLAVRAVRGG